MQTVKQQVGSRYEMHSTLCAINRTKYKNTQINNKI